MERAFYCRTKLVATKVVNALNRAGFNARIDKGGENDYLQGYYAMINCDDDEYWGKVHPLACQLTWEIACAKRR